MKKLSYVFIILGILIAIYPVASHMYGEYWQQKLLLELVMNEIDEVDKVEDMHIEELRIVGYEELDEAFQDTGDLIQINTSGEESITTLGIIEIPKINLTLPILEGTSKKNLSRGAGHITGTSMPGQVGNSAIAAHRGHTYGRFFNRLNELEIGDEIIIKIGQQTFKYNVYWKVVVDPSDISVLRGNEVDKILTLITCDPLYTATHRLIIQCKVL